MRITLLLLALTMLLTGCAVNNALTPGREQLMVADRLYYAGTEGNTALVISAKFLSRREQGDVINLRTAVGRYNNQTWTLGDILVKVDLNANGTTATWTVSGPSPLVQAYGVKLKDLERRRVLSSLGWYEIDAHPTGYYESNEP